MRYKKKDILKTISMLKQVNAVFRTGGRKAVLSVKAALPDCQEAAIEIGTYLETLGEEAEHLVKILESYCENIYLQNINFENPEKCRNIARKIQRQLSEVENGVKSSLPKDKKEVLFLPYKASMWDSLESVWMAAREDENCEAVVMPVPYFDKNPDGSLGEMHYEGGKFPDYVPVMDWKRYSIPEHRPDVIYIHNPYDQYNHVTSVHPDFYSAELKKHTDMLIYIPYFITMGGVSEEFCTLPACYYADYVFLESERVKKIYLETYGKVYGKEKDKFIVFGSPKFDPILHRAKSDYRISDIWNGKELRDGRKTVLLYNTSLGALLKENEAYLKKMKSVFLFFQQEKSRKKNDLLLWWRPHPLYEATLKAMRPQLLQEYRELVEYYKENETGIYDTSPDMARAVVCSDAYYGDRSSLVQLYGITGKPIMITDVNSETVAEDATGAEKLLQSMAPPYPNKINGYLIQESRFSLAAFVDYVSRKKPGYQERMHKQSMCYRSSMECSGDNVGKRIYHYVDVKGTDEKL